MYNGKYGKDGNINVMKMIMVQYVSQLISTFLEWLYLIIPGGLQQGGISWEVELLWALFHLIIIQFDYFLADATKVEWFRSPLH